MRIDQSVLNQLISGDDFLSSNWDESNSEAWCKKKSR